MSVVDIGPHRLRVGSATDDLSVLVDRQPHVLYSDPPWGDGNMRYWETMHRKMTGVEVGHVQWRALMESIAHLAFLAKHVFIEMGPRWADELAEILVARGVPNVNIHYGVVYGSKNWPLPVIYAGQPYTFAPDFPTKGYSVPRQAIRSVATPGGLLIDPCCGNGYSARAAIEAGMVFHGNELNAKRAEKTRGVLERLVGKPSQK
jgi:hypothetical protein